MSVKELNATLRDFERGARAMEKAHKMERILNERKERTFQITLAAEEMQKRGASQRIQHPSPTPTYQASSSPRSTPKKSPGSGKSASPWAKLPSWTATRAWASLSSPPTSPLASQPAGPCPMARPASKAVSS